MVCTPGAGQVPLGAERQREEVVAVGTPAQPVGAQDDLLRRAVRVDHRRAVREVEAAELALVPHRLAEQAHLAGPPPGVLARGGQVRAGAVPGRQVKRRRDQVPHRRERQVGMLPRALRQPGVPGWVGVVGRFGVAAGLSRAIRVRLPASPAGPWRRPATADASGGVAARSTSSAGTSASAVCSNCCNREVSRSLTRSAARWVGQPRNFSKTSTALEFSPSYGDLALVGEQVVAQVHRVGERVDEHPQRPGPGQPGGYLGAGRVLDQVRRPRRPADPAPHLHVLDRVGDPAHVDVLQLPHRLDHEVVRAGGEALAPVLGHGGNGARPQVFQARLGRVRRLRAARRS